MSAPDITDEMRAISYAVDHGQCENCGDVICVSSTCECPEPAALADKEDPGLLYCSRACRAKHGAEENDEKTQVIHMRCEHGFAICNKGCAP